MEQALTDLLPREQTARFYVEGLLRADIKTRYEVYGMGIASGILDAESAQRMEGLVPGSVEIAPVPFAPPAATPASLPYERSLAGQVRCDGQHTKRISGVPRVMKCNRLLAERGPFVGTCPRCKKVYAPPVEAEGPSDTELMFRALTESLTAFMSREDRQPSPVEIHNHVQQPPAPVQNVTINPAPVSPTPIEVRNEVSPTPVEVRNEITVEPSAVTVEPTPVEVRNEITVPAQSPAEVVVNVEPTPVEVRNEVSPTPVDVHVTNVEPKRSTTRNVVRDEKNRIIRIEESA